jgi:membrane protease YdiL (CAAX protease family)
MHGDVIQQAVHIDQHIDKINQDQWQIRDLVVAIVIMVVLQILFVLFGSIFFSHDSFAVDIGTFLIDIVVILFLNSKYPIKFLHVDSLSRVFIYGLGWSLLPLMIFIYQIVSQNFKTPSNITLFHQFNYFEKVVFFMTNTILPAFFEETLFRGYFYRILRNRYDIFWGVLISTLLFAAAHGFQTPIIFQSLLYAYVYEKTGSIWGSTLTHFMNNFIWFVFAYGVIKGA